MNLLTNSGLFFSENCVQRFASPMMTTSGSYCAAVSRKNTSICGYDQALTPALMTSTRDTMPDDRPRNCSCNNRSNRREQVSSSANPQPNVLESPSDKIRKVPAGFGTANSAPRVPWELMWTGL